MPIPSRLPTLTRHRRRAAFAVVIILALAIARPTLAAVVLSHYWIIESSTGLILEWGTTSEVDVAGFAVLVKPDPAPEAAYQAVGYVPALGSPNTEAVYSFPVPTLEIGVTYCVRLAERTTTGIPGEVIDRCGYAIDPTIPKPVVVGLTPTSTPTPTSKPIPVPEPVTLLLFGAGLAGIGVAVRRRR
jgi:hypothetical protein